MRQQILAAASSPGSSAPPVTITGVAPWAFQQPLQQPHQDQHQHQQRRVKMAVLGRSPDQQPQPVLSSSSSSFSSSFSSSPTGLQLVRRYMKRCRVSGSGGDPASADEEDDDDDDDDDEGGGAPSWWSQEQASLQPKLLPLLRFHDLVFGRVLGEGSFGTVKVRGCMHTARVQSTGLCIHALTLRRLTQHNICV
jgi:hypothetical protein